jgi:UDP:flavonoid glycosyltransferase YjiC (YdhE family)
MRVLMTTWAWRSHFNPLVPLGWALRAAGHEVMVASHPAFASTITSAGLPALPVGRHIDLVEEIRQALARSTWKPRPSGRTDSVNPIRRRRGLSILRLAANSAEAMAEDTMRFAERWRPDAVVYEPFAFLGPVAAGALGVPALRHLWTVDTLGDITHVEDELLGPLATKLGAPRVNALGDVTLDPWSPTVADQSPHRRQPIRYVPYNGPATLPDWLRTPPERPRIAVTWGTSIDGMKLDNAFLAPAVVGALAKHDVEVVCAVVSNQKNLFGDTVPDNVRHIGPVPLDLLLPTCDAIVHQGGGGTLMTAAKAGVPQFVMPYLPDTTFNAERVEATGAGHCLFGGDATPERLADELHAFLADLDPYRDAAHRLQAAQQALPSPAQVVQQWERDGVHPLVATGAH